MGWTEERVELLKKLWADGLSASQIAGRLGGITRNAVIGKVHRLGLAGRATTSRMRAPRLRHRTPPHTPARPTPSPAARVQYRTHGNAALKTVAAPQEQRTVALSVVPSVIVEEENAPSALRVPLLDLKENMCRWPIGDPQDENFHFCGCQKAGNGPYCEHHSRIAFQQVVRRKK
ncbi:MAG: GcrA family cell cycle regulator [Alphaproteobacteria bacterium]